MPKQRETRGAGHIYCLVNESFAGQVKVGITHLTIEERMSQLFTTGVPTPFHCFCAKRVPNPKKIEQNILKAFQPLRASGREFLRIDPMIVQCIFDMFPGKWVVRDGSATQTSKPVETAMMTPAVQHQAQVAPSAPLASAAPIQFGQVLFAPLDTPMTQVRDTSKRPEKTPRLSKSLKELIVHLHMTHMPWEEREKMLELKRPTIERLMLKIHTREPFLTDAHALLIASRSENG